ncbi:MAG: response regulator transcription factor [Flavobacteriales bacterium]|nr:response regulator transcription factor [Flavobacteriales bacterium]
MNAVIIDDEPQAITALALLIGQLALPCTVVATAHSALEGIKAIQKHKPDLVLLDIEMPHGSGFDLLEAFPDRKFQVVYTTAHEQHAIRAAHTHPFDYLLKPVDPDDLKRVLGELAAREPKPAPQRIEISSLQGKVFLRVKDIVRIEADGGYSTIHLSNGEKHVASKSIGHFEELLPKETFFRCHHSHLLNLSYVKAYLNQDGGMAQLRDGSTVPVASRRNAAFLERFEALT